MNYFVGIDPGQSGGLAILTSTEIVNVIKFKDQTPADISDIFEYLLSYDTCAMFAFIEKVHAMPKQGVTSTFKFGVSYGFLQGMLVAHKIPYDFVTPQKWQKELGCMSKGDKNITKQKAQQLYPKMKITHAIADAILIAEYCRRTKI
ncbi:MAG: hypothetical protein M0R74_15470 [Dehalococcoidia bacterium]|nr:hypothetical protein [Candidatus Neomarinimicrobiota bacterium]MCK9520403.1 hypothetical protein [Dehalococcoidia bacterium]